MSHKRWVMLSLALISIMLVLSACSGDEDGLLGVFNREEDLSSLEAAGFLEAQQVSVVSEVSGLVLDVLVGQADQVTAGQVVIMLDDALLQAELLQVQASVTIAEANLAELTADSTPEELAAAEAIVLQAEAAYNGAVNASVQAWAAVNNPRNINVEIQAVELEMAEIDRQIEGLRALITETEVERDLVEEKEPQDQAEIDLLNYQIDQLEAQLAAAEALYSGAARKLYVLQSQRARPLLLIAEAHGADSQVAIAEAQLDLAQAQYDALVAGPTDEEIAIAEAQIALAESQVAMVEAQIAQLTLVSPIDGVVTTRSIAPGETAYAGVPLLTIANLQSLKLVIYIPETEIGMIRLNTPVDIFVDAYPTRVFVGYITNIGKEAEFTPSNVQTEEERVNLVFAVEISIDNADGILKPGMPADVTIRID